MPVSYFPCSQNENNTVPESLINFILDGYIQDGDNFLLCNFDNYYPNAFYFLRWKDYGMQGGIQPDGYTFWVEKSGSGTRFFNGIIIASGDTWAFNATNDINIIYSPLPLVSSKADSRISFITNVTFYSTGPQILIEYPYSEEPAFKEFTINNIWAHGTWLTSGLSNMGAQNFRLVKGKMLTGAKIAFYPQPNIIDGKLKLNVVTTGTFDGIQYSEDGTTWHDSASFPYTFFYKERTNEIGTFDFGLTFYASIPVFADKTTADKYIANDPSVSEKDATNWPQISGKYPITNTTGSALPASSFGDVKLKSFFTQQYICDSTCLSALANDLFDTTAAGWEAIKKGLEMYSANIDAVMGLSFWPFDVSTFIGAGNYAAAQYIWLGGYGWDTTGHGTCNHIIYASGHKDLGVVRITPTFNSWRDYEPYTKLFVSIPFCGTYQLDLSRYMDKDVRVRYFIDTRTNGCICALIADGYLMDYFNGQMGVTMPINLTDFTTYANSQINTLLGGGGQAINAFGSSTSAANAGLAAAGTGGALLAGGATAAVGGAVTGAKTVYGLTMNNINNYNKTKGGSSSMLNCYLPQTVDFFFEIQESCEPDNYNAMFGAPSLVGGQIFNFTGYLKCQSVKLECGIATEREREKLKSLLLNGIYI